MRYLILKYLFDLVMKLYRFKGSFLLGAIAVAAIYIVVACGCTQLQPYVDAFTRLLGKSSNDDSQIVNVLLDPAGTNVLKKTNAPVVVK